MNKKALSLAVCLAMALPTASNALSLGDIESDSSLNQPFRGTISLLSTSIAEASSLTVKVASPSVFTRVGIDRPAFLNSIRFRTTVKDGRPVILVSSNQPINEPFLNFLLEVSWPNGQLLKEYTVLLDPPVLMQADTAIASSAAGVRKEPGVQQQRRAAIAPAQATRQQPRRVVRTATPAAAKSKLRRPGPPLRSASASTSGTKNYRVRRGDTLYKVARKLGYKGVRKEQMMMALFNKNQRAFSQQNINNLKAGAVLARPSYQEAKAVSSRTAKSEVVAQARSWKQARGGATTKKSTRRSVASTNRAAKPARLEVMGGSKSINSLATPGGAGSANLTGLKKQLALTNEALTTRLKENNDLKSRVSELESLLRKKNKLITLKSEQLSRLQEKMGNAGGEIAANVAQTDPVVNTSVASPSENDDGTGIQQSVANMAAIDAGQITRTESDQLGINTDNQLVIDDFQEAEPDAFVNNEPAEESLDIMGLLTSPAAMGIGGGTLMALLGGLWFMRRRKSENDEYQDFDPIEIDDQIDDMAFDEPAFPNSNSESDESAFDESAFDESAFSSSDLAEENSPANANDDVTKVNEQEDILQEADVYIVYGLYDQAEAELKTAIEADPNNLAYRAKLLENYKAAGNKEAFEVEAKAFMDLNVNGKEAYLGNITEWGNALLPENKLFDGDTLKTAAGVAGAGVAMVAGTALAKSDDEQSELIDSVTDDNVSNFDAELDGLDLDTLLSETNDGETDFNIDSNDQSLDFDVEASDNLGFDIDKEISDEEFDLEMDSNEKLLESVDNNEIDFLDTDIAEIKPEIDFLDTIETKPEVDFLDTIETKPEIDFLDTSEVKPEINLNEGLEASNLNLNLDSDDFEKIMPKDNAYKKPIVEDLEEENLLANFDDNLSFLDLDDDSETIEETQIDTKLDLARAYIDMGDIEGARSALEEVLLDGSDEQKREAEDLLHQTG